MTAEKRGGSHKSRMGQDRDRVSQGDQRKSGKDNIGGVRDSVANSLRKAYQQTIAEDVPDEMLELLKKLG